MDVPFRGAKQASRPLQVDLAGRCEADRARGAKEERVFEDAFKLAYLLGERRLSEVEFFGGAAEVQLLGNSYEVTQMTKFYPEIHTLKIIIKPNNILDMMLVRSHTSDKEL
jgi:hypothetical protein